MKSILRDLFEDNSASFFKPYYNRLKKWEHWNLFLSCFDNLKLEYLYQSHIHGIGHIERVLLHGAIICMDNHFSSEDTLLALTACSYHDVGRIDDSLDDFHGGRSALQIPDITGLTGENLVIVQAAITAHSLNDSKMDEVISGYEIEKKSRARKIACLLKDADGLDRVRVSDLDPKYLRFKTSQNYIVFANCLYQYYCEKESE